MTPDELREKLKDLRQKQPLSRKDFAKMIGVSPSAYSRFERGVTQNLRPENRSKAAALLQKEEQKLREKLEKYFTEAEEGARLRGQDFWDRYGPDS